MKAEIASTQCVDAVQLRIFNHFLIITEAFSKRFRAAASKPVIAFGVEFFGLRWVKK